MQNLKFKTSVTAIDFWVKTWRFHLNLSSLIKSWSSFEQTVVFSLRPSGLLFWQEKLLSKKALDLRHS